ncbi:AMP-binding protein, partial [Rhodococcus sp. 14C212]|uniref:AMP-binding protein n=1 Tax=Rhodococcus sp. 14C212 TaxID=2711209 RepID=UPI0013EE00BB
PPHRTPPAALVLAPPGVFGGAELARLLREQRVTHVVLTPTVLGTVDPDGLGGVRGVTVAGEACPASWVARWAPGRSVFDAYGPSEATVMSNISAPLPAGGPVTVGPPTAGFAEVVLDGRLRPVPVGV